MLFATRLTCKSKPDANLVKPNPNPKPNFKPSSTLGQPSPANPKVAPPIRVFCKANAYAPKK